jgi:hypothetical protein
MAFAPDNAWAYSRITRTVTDPNHIFERTGALLHLRNALMTALSITMCVSQPYEKAVRKDDGGPDCFRLRAGRGKSVILCHHANNINKIKT